MSLFCDKMSTSCLYGFIYLACLLSIWALVTVRNHVRKKRISSPTYQINCTKQASSALNGIIKLWCLASMGFWNFDFLDPIFWLKKLFFLVQSFDTNESRLVNCLLLRAKANQSSCARCSAAAVDAILTKNLAKWDKTSWWSLFYYWLRLNIFLLISLLKRVDRNINTFLERVINGRVRNSFIFER